MVPVLVLGNFYKKILNIKIIVIKYSIDLRVWYWLSSSAISGGLHMRVKYSSVRVRNTRVILKIYIVFFYKVGRVYEES
jgi:hypothetical protein